MMDVHLMVNPVDRLIGDFVEAGADMITFHPEASIMRFVRFLDRLQGPSVTRSKSCNTT